MNTSQMQIGRTPLGDATQRVNNSNYVATSITGKQASSLAHQESLTRRGLCIVSDTTSDSAGWQSGTNPPERHHMAGSRESSIPNPRLSAISKDGQIPNPNRSSQISTTSTTGSDGRRRKTHIGPWHLGKTLGKGATARVRMARHCITGQLAAIKIVQKKNAQLSQAGSLAALDLKDAALNGQDDGARKMPFGIEREVAIMKLIEHPHIMKLYDIWENRTEMQDFSYLALAYL